MCLVTSGSEFGWRNGSGKWPAYYPDSVPAIYNIGPGSPTGICFGYGTRFPAKYQEALAVSRQLTEAGGPDAALAKGNHAMILVRLATIERDWRHLEQNGDATAFQSFDWLAAWHRHIGLRARVQPAVAVGRFADGDTAFIVPLCVAPHGPARRLCWLGQELCDYNAPLLACHSAELHTDRRRKPRAFRPGRNAPLPSGGLTCSGRPWLPIS